jgi:hypothetical protein
METGNETENTDEKCDFIGELKDFGALDWKRRSLDRIDRNFRMRTRLRPTTARQVRMIRLVPGCHGLMIAQKSATSATSLHGNGLVGNISAT